MIEKIIKEVVRTIPNFPIKGVMFRDITSLINKPIVFKKIIDNIILHAKKNKITKVIGIDSRGFIFAAPIAYKLGIPLVLIRKKNKLPGKTYKSKYALEYGYDVLEIHKESINKNDNVMIIDDLIATGGTAIASSKLISNTNLKKILFLFLIELIDLNGADRLRKKHKVISLSKYNEDELWV